MKKTTFLFFLLFLSGVICANISGIVYGRELGAMNEYFINRYMYADIQGSNLFLFLFYERLPRFVLLAVVSVGIYGTLVVDGYICYLGFSVGFLSVIAIMNYGIKGILLVAGFFLPHWLFYAPVLLIWQSGLYYYKRQAKDVTAGGQKKRHMKLAVSVLLAGLLLLLGLFAESYANPFILQKIVRIID